MSNGGAGWHGHHGFALSNLVLKDFRVRYRNMSLGVFWSLLNPIIMVAVLTFVFTQVFTADDPRSFPLFVLCGLLPYNFFAQSWGAGTTSLLDNASLIKKIPVPRELIPVASVLSLALHLLIQICLLLAVALVSGFGFNWYWLWMPYLWGMEILFAIGFVMATSALAIYVRDIRYIVDSSNLVLFWLVPIFYPFSMVKPEFAGIYQLNPVAAIVLALRHILLEGMSPPASLLWKLSAVSITALAIGWTIFTRLKFRFYDHL
jgi:ABC-type polysaccharide/polyol phosphate export permease